MDDIKSAIRAFILVNYLPGESPANLHDDTRLVSSGILDSQATMALSEFVERQFGVELSAVDTMAENFDRVEDIARLVALKRAA